MRETLGVHQAVLPKDIVTDALHSGARILRTAREVSRTGKNDPTPRDFNTAVATPRLTPPIPSFKSTSSSPTWTQTQDIVGPSRYIITTKAKNTNPLDAPINGCLAVHGHSTFIFNIVIGPKTLPRESTNVHARKRMDFTSNYVIGESPNFMNLGLSPANTADKIKSVISPDTRFEVLTDGSYWLASRHGIEEITAGRVSETKAYMDYIKNYEFETN